MLKNNPSDGYGDEKFASSQSGDQKSPWPKSSSCNDRIALSAGLQHELSNWIEGSLALLEEAHQSFITSNSRRKEIRQSR